MSHQSDDSKTPNVEAPAPRHYWDHPPSKRARPQFDPAALARDYLDDMEKGGRLHHQRKRA